MYFAHYFDPTHKLAASEIPYLIHTNLRSTVPTSHNMYFLDYFLKHGQLFYHKPSPQDPIFKSLSIKLIFIFYNLFLFIFLKYCFNAKSTLSSVLRRLSSFVSTVRFACE